MNFIVSVILPPRGAVDFAVSSHPAYPVLAPIAVYEDHVLGEISAERTGYIRVVGAPFKTAADFAATLCQPHEKELNIGTAESPKLALVKTAQKKWVGDHAQLPEKAIGEMLDRRYAELTWAEFAAIYGREDSPQTEKFIDDQQVIAEIAQAAQAEP